jgi:hypothetical protein
LPNNRLIERIPQGEETADKPTAYKNVYIAIAEDSTTKSHYIQITFEATDVVGVDNIECRLDGQVSTSSCTSPIVYDQLKKGTRTFTVRSTDAAGNTVEDQFAWTAIPRKQRR